jgi:hypothetical protein
MPRHPAPLPFYPFKYCFFPATPRALLHGKPGGGKAASHSAATVKVAQIPLVFIFSPIARKLTPPHVRVFLWAVTVQKPCVTGNGERMDHFEGLANPEI